MEASFTEARKKAPSILFIDELDAFGNRAETRGDNHSYEVKAIDGLLEMMDGIDDREGVVLIGACNHPHLIDPAILRSGRMDRHIAIPLPDEEARAAIHRMHLRGDLSGEDYIEFARETEGLTGADIERIVRQARRIARRERRGLTADDVRAVLPRKLTLPPDALHANAVHEIGHAVVGVALGMTLHDVSIQPSLRLRNSAQPLGGARFSNDVWLRRTKTHFLDTLALYMGGIAAEELFLGEHDDGSTSIEGSDLYEATKIAIALERSYGMGHRLASYGKIDERRFDEIKHSDPILMGAGRHASSPATCSSEGNSGAAPSSLRLAPGRTL